MFHVSNVKCFMYQMLSVSCNSERYGRKWDCGKCSNIQKGKAQKNEEKCQVVIRIEENEQEQK